MSISFLKCTGVLGLHVCIFISVNHLVFFKFTVLLGFHEKYGFFSVNGRYFLKFAGLTGLQCYGYFCKRCISVLVLHYHVRYNHTLETFLGTVIPQYEVISACLSASPPACSS